MTQILVEFAGCGKLAPSDLTLSIANPDRVPLDSVRFGKSECIRYPPPLHRFLEQVTVELDFRFYG